MWAYYCMPWSLSLLCYNYFIKTNLQQVMHDGSECVHWGREGGEGRRDEGVLQELSFLSDLVFLAVSECCMWVCVWEGGHRRLLTWQWLYQEYRGMQDTGYDLLTCMAVGLKVSVAKMWACAGMYLTTCLQLGGDWLHTQLALPITLFFFSFIFFLFLYVCSCVHACVRVHVWRRKKGW